MIQIPTVSEELAKSGSALFSRFERLLAAEYPLAHQTLAVEHITAHGLVFRWMGAASAKPIVLMAHIDVVPAAASDGWTDDPFAGAIRDGSIWGRGALDDKGALLMIFEAVENLIADGFEPAQDVYLCFGGNEETYGAAAAEIAATFRGRGVIPWLVLDEGGAIIRSPFPGITIPIAMVGVAEKGLVTLILRANADPGHASAPAPNSAVARIARAVSRIEGLRFHASLPRPTRAMLASLAPHASLNYRIVLSNLWFFQWPLARLFAARGGETAAMTRTTIAVTRLEGGTAGNVLPASASATLNIRVALGETADGVISRIRRRIADPAVTIEETEKTDPSPVASSASDQFALIAGAIASSYPGTVCSPYAVMAATDSRHFHEFTPFVFRFSPVAMTEQQRASIHGVNEHVTIDSLEHGERFFQVLIRKLPD